MKKWVYIYPLMIIYLFRAQLFVNNNVQFSNDGPLGAMNSQQVNPNTQLFGGWQDLNGIGGQYWNQIGPSFSFRLLIYKGWVSLYCSAVGLYLGIKSSHHKNRFVGYASFIWLFLMIISLPFIKTNTLAYGIIGITPLIFVTLLMMYATNNSDDILEVQINPTWTP